MRVICPDFTMKYKVIILHLTLVFQSYFMLDQLFGSKTRVALLKLFFENPNRAYFVRELTREIDAQINSVRRELDNLMKLGIVKVVEEIPEQQVPEWEDAPRGLNKKKFYQINEMFVLQDELSSLFSKSHLMLEKDLMNQLSELPNVYLLVMTGFFTGITESAIDILVVGNVNKEKLRETMQQFERKLGREINYSIMSLKEFEYRQEITDKFLYDILVNPKIVITDKIGLEEQKED